MNFLMATVISANQSGKNVQHLIVLLCRRCLNWLTITNRGDSCKFEYVSVCVLQGTI